ncbi:MAG: formate dehydrogenase accessory sulfurtransferase FdhD, partial [Caldimonas sp.]
DRPLPPVVATARAGADEPMPPGAARVSVVPLRGGAGAAGEARAAEELAVAIEVDGTCQGAMLTTPSDLEDLVLGHLLTEGVVDAAADLLGVEVVPVGAGIVLRATIAPACSERLKANPTRFASGLGGRSAAAWLDAAVRPVRRGGAVVEIEPAALARGMRELAAGQALWRATGANHAAAWVSLSGELLVVREDVGRRNAVDKLVGAMARAGTDPTRGFIAVTSRVSGEMVHKVARAGVGLLAAISAPTAAAIRLAEESGMVLAGFARGDDATIYSHPERVRRDPAPRS